MNRKFKIKIVGESPRSLVLAYILAKFNCEVHIYDFLINSKINENDKIFSFTNCSKGILSKFGIWREFEGISYHISSMCFKENEVSEELIMRSENLSQNNSNSFGWIVKYSDMKKVLIDKIINIDNVYFISNDQLLDDSLNFDFEFIFKNPNKKNNLFKFPPSSIKGINERVLIFNVYIRANVDFRFYEIHTNQGLIVLTPLDNNLYQITWKNNTIKSKDMNLYSKSFLLDNLTTLLPNDLKIDQIIGDINFFYINNLLPSCFIKNKSIYFNEDKFKCNPLYDFNFDLIIRFIFQIYNLFENAHFNNIQISGIIKFYYFIKYYVELKIKLAFTNFLINIFILNNILYKFLRRVLFIFSKKIYLIKTFITNYLINFNINKLIK